MNEKITLQDLVDLLSIKHEITKKQADAIVRNFFDVIEEALSTEKYVKIKGLGTFKLTEVDSRESMNVNTGERIEIQGHTKISFTPDATMKELINKPFSHFETVVLNEGVQLEDVMFEKTTPESEKDVLITEIQQEETAIETEAKPEETIDEMVEKVNEQPEVVVSNEEVEEEKVALVETEIQEVTVEETPAITEEIVSTEEKQEETQPKELQPEKKQSEQVIESHYPNNRRTFNILIGTIVVLVLIILFGLYWMFLRSNTAETSKVESVPVQESPINVVQEDKATKEDTLQMASDTVIATQPVVQEQTAILSEGIEYTITGTIATLTLEPGQTLVKLALKYYGSKNFWPYIMQHNPGVIKDADIVPIGATIKIPKLEPKK